MCAFVCVRDQLYTDAASTMVLDTDKAVLCYVGIEPLLVDGHNEDGVNGLDKDPLSATLAKLYLQDASRRNDVVVASLPWRSPQQQGEEKHVAVEQGSKEEELECQSQDQNQDQDQDEDPYQEDNDTNSPRWVCTATLRSSHRNDGLVEIPSEDPTVDEPILCRVVVFGVPSFRSQRLVTITASTLVRVLPVQTNGRDPASAIRASLVGELPDTTPVAVLDDILRFSDPMAVKALQFRMSQQLSRTVLIGSTRHAVDRCLKREEGLLSMKSGIRRYRKLIDHKDSGNESDKVESERKSRFSVNTRTASQHRQLERNRTKDSLLVIHSPHHGHGKTLLAKAVARRLLRCNTVHLVHLGAILAKWGVEADAAVEVLLHSFVLSAALQAPCSPVCVVLDGLDGMIPSSTERDAGSADDPIINAVGSCLKRIVSQVGKGRFPFPTKDPLYNLGDDAASACVRRVRLCLIATITCNDGKVKGGKQSDSNQLHFLPGGRFLLPNQTTRSMIDTLRRHLQLQSLVVSDAAQRVIEDMVESTGSSFAWNSAATFIRTLSSHMRGTQRERIGKEEPVDEPIIVSVVDVAHVLKRMAENCDLTDVSIPANSFNVLASTQPSSSLSNDIAAGNPKSNIGFHRVGGNMQAKAALEDALALDPTRLATLRRFGMAPPLGVLLYGPPGTGKTLLAKAVAETMAATKPGQRDSWQHSNGSFVSLETSEIVRSEVGNSEKRVVSAFERARANAPSVVFIDEFQALFTERSSVGSSQLASTLLQCMDDLSLYSEAAQMLEEKVGVANVGNNEANDDAEHDKNKRVVVLAATNTPWMVDKAFLRPGRFDRVVRVGLPTASERGEILTVLLQDMRLENDTRDEAFVKELAEATEGFSGADLAALCRAAASKCLNESEISAPTAGMDLPFVSTDQFRRALREDVRPSSSHALVRRLNDWKPT